MKEDSSTLNNAGNQTRGFYTSTADSRNKKPTSVANLNSNRSYTAPNLSDTKYYKNSSLESNALKPRPQAIHSNRLNYGSFTNLETSALSRLNNLKNRMGESFQPTMSPIYSPANETSQEPQPKPTLLSIVKAKSLASNLVNSQKESNQTSKSNDIILQSLAITLESQRSDTSKKPTIPDESRILSHPPHRSTIVVNAEVTNSPQLTDIDSEEPGPHLQRGVYSQMSTISSVSTMSSSSQATLIPSDSKNVSRKKLRIF